MSLSDLEQESNLDSNFDMILLLYNTNPEELIYELPEELIDLNFSLHPDMANEDRVTAQTRIKNNIVTPPALFRIVLAVAEDSLKTDIEARYVIQPMEETDISALAPGEAEEIQIEAAPAN